MAHDTRGAFSRVAEILAYLIEWIGLLAEFWIKRPLMSAGFAVPWSRASRLGSSWATGRTFVVSAEGLAVGSSVAMSEQSNMDSIIVTMRARKTSLTIPIPTRSLVDDDNKIKKRIALMTYFHQFTEWSQLDKPLWQFLYRRKGKLHNV